MKKKSFLNLFVILCMLLTSLSAKAQNIVLSNMSGQDLNLMT